MKLCYDVGIIWNYVGFRDIIPPRIDNQMKKNMENDTATGMKGPVTPDPTSCPILLCIGLSILAVLR